MASVARRAAWLVLAGILLGAVPAPARPPLQVAVAPFADDSVDGFRIDAPRMHVEFASLLSAFGAGRVEVLPVALVESALRDRGLRGEDLSRWPEGSAVAAAVGARWLVTGRWTVLEVDRPEPSGASGQLIRPVLAHAALEVKVLDVAERRLVLRELFSAATAGAGTRSLREAARAVLRQAAVRLAGL